MDHLNELKQLTTNYLKSPGSKAINKTLQVLYKDMGLHLFKEDDLEESVDRDLMIKNFILKKDDVEPKFDYLNTVSYSINKGKPHPFRFYGNV